MSFDQAETARPTLDEDKVEAFAGQVVTDIRTVLAGATTYIGHHTGLYAAIAEGEPLTATSAPSRPARTRAT